MTGRRAVILAAAAPLGGLLVALSLGLVRGRPSDSANGPSEAPAFTSTTLRGEPFVLVEHRDGRFGWYAQGPFVTRR